LISSQVSARIALILPAGFLETVPMQVPRYQAQKIAMLVQPLRHRFQFSADLVFGEKIEYAGLDGAFLAHCRLRRLRVSLWNQSLDAKVYLKLPGFAR
jgi:hypothetical protein